MKCLYAMSYLSMLVFTGSTRLKSQSPVHLIWQCHPSALQHKRALIDEDIYTSSPGASVSESEVPDVPDVPVRDYHVDCGILISINLSSTAG